MSRRRLLFVLFGVISLRLLGKKGREERTIVPYFGRERLFELNELSVECVQEDLDPC